VAPVSGEVRRCSAFPLPAPTRLHLRGFLYGSGCCKNPGAKLAADPCSCPLPPLPPCPPRSYERSSQFVGRACACLNTQTW
jgi:hypothetical protein